MTGLPASPPGIIAGLTSRRLPAAPSYPDLLARERRRRLGIYYTPAPLVIHLVRAVLLPLLPRVVRAVSRAGGRKLERCLSLRVLDPAMGDGAFLRAAADLIASRVARAVGLPPAAVRPLVVARCLCGVDIDPAAVSLARESLAPGTEGAALVQADFLAERPPLEGPFDAVLGNPPWGGWDRRLDRRSREEIRARFATARGRIEPAVLFIERTTALLEPGGRLGLALPDYLLLKNYPLARRHLLRNYWIEELAHWGRAFAGVNLDACTLVARRERDRPPRRHTILCLPDGPGGRIVTAPQSRFETAPGHTFNLSLDADGAALLRRLERIGTPLGRLMETHEGIHSGNIRRRLFVPPASAAAPSAGAPPLRPLLLGRDEIRPFRLAWRGWRVVYCRDTVRRARGEYANLGRERWFTSRKILVRRTGDRVIAALDRRGLFASNNLFVALPRKECPLPIEYLEGYLNSSLATWCFRAMQPRAGRLFAELKLVHLNRLPVPAPRGRGAAARVAEVVSLVRRLRREPEAGRAPLDAVFARLASLSAKESGRVSREMLSTRRASPL